MTVHGGAAPVAAFAQAAAERLVPAAVASGVLVGVGIDAVDVDRFRLVLSRRAHLVDRLFTEGERRYARAAHDPVPRLSTRFAAKEATMKALGVGLGAFRFDEVEVIRDGLEAPSLVLHASAADLAGRAGVCRWHLSLTHTDHVAVAMVVAVGSREAVGSADGPSRP